MDNKLMCHVVAGYPSAQECIELMLGMQEIGIGIIEVQIPFSDPIADGETIMQANDRALEQGMTTAGSFELVKQARARGLKADIYLMSYTQKLIHLGIEAFCRNAAKVGVRGLIIPDLPFDSPEYGELERTAKKHSLLIVPVLSPGMPKQRLEEDLNGHEGLVYLTSMKGITGSKLRVSDDLADLCAEVRKLSPGSVVAIGFGIQNKQDVSRILKIADIAVVGSSVIREIKKSGIPGGLKLIDRLTG